jgi:TonB-dependent receptor
MPTFLHRGFEPKRKLLSCLLCLLLPALNNLVFAQTIQINTADSNTLNRMSKDTLLPGRLFAVLKGNQIQPGTDKEGAQLLKRLPGVIVYENPKLGYQLQSLNINGLGERYNQVLLNGAPVSSSDPETKAFPFALLPAEAIEEVFVQKKGQASLPGDMAGGSIGITLKDKPAQNFFYVLAGGGYSDQTNGNDFRSSDRNAFEWSGFPGQMRDLPAGFPNTRSEFSLSQMNPQEQVYWSKQLRNNLAPVNNGTAKPNFRGMLGFGRTIKLKKGEQLNIMAWVNHQTTQRIDESERQVAPDITRALIRSQSHDVSYLYQAQSSAIVSASLLYNRSKISFKGMYGNQYSDVFTQRSQLYKPDEDSLAHTGLHYATTQRSLLNLNVTGLHALGAEGKLKLDWLVSYAYYGQYNPDERNFLLRQDSTSENQFEIARPSQASLSSADAMFTNSGRSWRRLKDHNFIGAANLSFPFQLFHYTQSLSGGIYVQNQFRVLYSDLFLVSGNGYYTPDNLLAPERYYPGGLKVTNFYEKYITSGSQVVPDHITVKNRGNYTASSNIGAAYIMLANRLTQTLSVDWGIRVESASNLVSATQYNFFETYKNPQLGTLDENDHVISFDFLPSVTLQYRPIQPVQLHASFFKTVNRPGLQELARYRIYDPLSFVVTTGNTLLNSTDVRNYEVGVDLLKGTAAHFAVSGFYKEIDQPIEYMLTGYANATGNLLRMPHNTPPATVRGLTATVNTNLSFIGDRPFLKHISLVGNGTWLRSKVQAGSVRSGTTPEVKEHTLSGSPGYTINAGLVVQYPRYPYVTILYNRTDDYLTAIGSGRSYLANHGEVRAIPDYRVKGRDQLDIQLSQQFFKSKWQLIAGVTNLTNSSYIQYQDLDGNKKFDSPLKLNNRNNTGGFFESGVDNTVISITPQRTYYITVSYLFK